MTVKRINREAIAETYQAIRSHIRRTPTIEVSFEDLGLTQSGSAVLKLELMQHAGSFKSRGAFANLLLRDIPDAGVTCASGGNHGAALAYAAHRLGYPARIFVPAYASEAKIARIRSLGGDVVVHGQQFSDVLANCSAHAQSSGALNVHAYDQRETLLGQGTVGLELETQAADVETMLIAVGGGGLIGGISAWFQDRISIVGVEPTTACALHAALEAGSPVDVTVAGLAADSLGAQRVGDLMFPLAQTFVEQVALVDDDAISAAQTLLWERLRVVAEPGGAAALAALISGAYEPRPDERVCVLVCGGNTGAVDFNR